MSDDNPPEDEAKRRRFLKQCLMGGCGLALGGYTAWDLFIEGGDSGLRVGFRNDAPRHLGRWSREAEWYEVSGLGDAAKIHCLLCPHLCILDQNDRGFCRTRVVKDRKLHTIAYGNPCAVHIDPIEKKPLNHFLPGTAILSIATAGCNLRCLNCQNWEISQAKPENTRNVDLLPERLVDKTRGSSIPSIAYTYSDPIIFYEYVYDSAVIAREHGIRNVLVTAGYILPKPLRRLCRVVDAANVDLKGFNDRFYRKVVGGKLLPVLKSLEIMREEGIWLELTRLIVPTLSDDLNDIRQMSKWIVEHLGPETPLHFSRFHPAYKLSLLPATPMQTLQQAKEIAQEAGIHHVYVGNIPLGLGQDTICHHCSETLIKRRGYHILSNKIEGGKCSCGEAIAGVWG